jgi:hypothetical protein
MGVIMKKNGYKKLFFVIEYHGKIDFSQIFVVSALFIVLVLMVNATFSNISDISWGSVW